MKNIKIEELTVSAGKLKGTVSAWSSVQGVKIK